MSPRGRVGLIGSGARTGTVRGKASSKAGGDGRARAVRLVAGLSGIAPGRGGGWGGGLEFDRVTE